MFDKTVSIKFNLGCLCVLTWIVLTAVGCSQQDSTVSAKPQSSTMADNPAGTSSTQINLDTNTPGTTFNEPRNSEGCEIANTAPGIYNLAMQHGGWQRNFVMSVPESTTGETLAHPLLIMMHGFGGSGSGMRGAIGRHNGIEDGSVVLYPDGVGAANTARGWNSGHPKCCGPALHNNVDDVAFLRDMVTAASQKTCIDLNRVYATGFSNGGDMAQRLACDASDVVAAVTSVAGRFDYHASACNGARPVPTVLYRGARDRTVPYEKTVFSLAAIKTIPAMAGFEKIARNHECQENPASSLSVGDTECLQFSQCKQDYEVTLCTSADAGHCWPGTNNCSSTGHGDAAIFSASEHMQEFFAKHALSSNEQ